jgi:histidinol phosphatase-like PHP family hydrolase
VSAIDAGGPGTVIDLHAHTIHSDGALAPAELARRAAVKGYGFLGLSDHVDQSNLRAVLAAAVAAAKALSGEIGLTLLAGVELTHVPPRQIGPMVALSRDLGADFVVVHGESPVEPVAPGTNIAAIEGGADILAHPGAIDTETARLAAQLGTRLELTVRGGHNLAHGRVAALAREFGAPLILNSDAHSPADLLTPAMQMAVALGAGLTYQEYREIVFKTSSWGAALAKAAGLIP